jgi:lysophospholipase L1-like esterase
MKAKHVLYFVLSVIAILGILMIVFPKNGIRINKDFILYMPSFEEMFFPKAVSKVDTDSIIKNQIDIDKLHPEGDSTGEFNLEEIKKLVTPMEFPANNLTALDPFFAKLATMDTDGKIRIMHYGDSQIEGDRITGFIRSKLQGRFGGKGMGLCNPVAIYSQFSIIQENSANWSRYSGFGFIDPNVKHNKYGPMIAFNRFAPLTDSTWKQPSTKYSASLSFSKSTIGYSNTAQFKNVSIYYGNSKASVKITVKSGETVLATDSLKSGDGLSIYTYKSSSYLDNIKFEFEGYDSPDFYSVSFEDDKGIYIDNVALRGSSGTVFTTGNGALLGQVYANLDVDLFILQFGGNSVPYIQDKKSAQQFANYFYYQMTYLKSLVPDVCIIVIGPSDMSVKIKDSYVTYPNLETIITEIKAATHKAGGVYWDMYKAMGGKNSMVAWVNSNPQMAGTDYTHFTPYGTTVISNMFYNSFIVEYSAYTERMKKK